MLVNTKFQDNTLCRFFMRAIAQNIYANPKYAKIFEWAKLITITGGGQIFVQAVGFLSGIIIIRLLPVKEFALYTLANTFLGTMTMLADSGITSGVMAEGGKVWKDKGKLGIVLVTGMKLKRKIGFISLTITIPIMAYLLSEHGASWLTTTLIILSIIPGFLAALTDSFLEMAPRLHQDVKSLQRNQVEVSLGRLILSSLLLFIFPFTYIGLIATNLPRIYGNYRLSKIASRFASFNEKPDPIVQKNVFKAVKRTLPIVLYHCISGQISIWLVSFFGTTTNVSEMGALGRVSVIFTLVAGLFSTLVVPRFSRMEASKRVLLKPFILTQISTLIISTFLLISIWILSDQILWVLGKNYISLKYELILVGVYSCIGLMSGICSSLVVSRGWYMNPSFLIAINFSSTVISLIFLKINTLTGILYFNVVMSTIAYLLVLIYGLISINKTTNS